MIIIEFIGTRTDGIKLYRRYSDKGVMLLQEETGILYGDPIDVEDAPYTYTETDILIEVEEHKDKEPSETFDIEAEELEVEESDVEELVEPME